MVTTEHLIFLVRRTSKFNLLRLRRDKFIVNKNTRNHVITVNHQFILFSIRPKSIFLEQSCYERSEAVIKILIVIFVETHNSHILLTPAWKPSSCYKVHVTKKLFKRCTKCIIEITYLKAQDRNFKFEQNRKVLKKAEGKLRNTKKFLLLTSRIVITKIVAKQKYLSMP